MPFPGDYAFIIFAEYVLSIGNVDNQKERKIEQKFRVMNEIFKIFSLIVGLKNNLPNGIEIEAYFVFQYHQLLDQLTKLTDENLNNFKVDEKEIIPERHYHQPDFETGEGGGYTYGPERYCDRTKLLAKLDGFIIYFQGKYLSEEKPSMGFNPPE